MSYTVHMTQYDYERITFIIEKYHNQMEKARERARNQGVSHYRSTTPKPIIDLIESCQPSKYVAKVTHDDYNRINRIIEIYQTRLDTSRKPLANHVNTDTSSPSLVKDQEQLQAVKPLANHVNTDGKFNLPKPIMIIVDNTEPRKLVINIIA